MDVIIDKLRQIEVDEDITILYAAEAGSRAWGHYNDKSDYDIRFIYKHNNLSDYLTIDKKRDVYEFDDGEYDIVGWDIKKALNLHYKSNPNLREWLISPVKYVPMEKDIFKGLPDFDKIVLKRYYYELARRHFNKHINQNDERSPKFYKKLVHTCRYILAWMLLDEDEYPSMSIEKLIEDNNLDKSLLDKLVKLKKSIITQNTGLIGDNEAYFLIEWVSFYVEYMKEDSYDKKIIKDIEVYNERFRDIILCNDF